MATYTGTSDDNSQVGTSAGETFDYSQGGHDTLTGGGGGDEYFFGAAFDALDKVIGSDGTFDNVYLDGDYSAGLTLTGDNLVNVDSLYLSNFSGSHLTLADSAVGATMSVELDGGIVDASDVTHGQLNFNLKATSGFVLMKGGALNDFATFSSPESRSFQFDGGGGQDTAYFQVDDSFHASAKMFVSVETFVVNADVSMVLQDGNVAAGATLNVVVGPPDGILHFDGHKELDGHFNFNAFAGNDDMIVGGHLADYVDAGGGADTIAGGGGADVLIGGDGADIFIFRLVADSSRTAADTITDLDNSDWIDLTRIDADRTTAGHQVFTLVSEFTGHAGELVVSYSGGMTSIMGDVNGDGRADLVINATGDHSDFTHFVTGA